MVFIIFNISYLFRFDNGQGHAHIRSDKKLPRYQWNTILASRSGKAGLLSINGGPVKMKISFGNLTRLNVDKVGYLGGLPQNARAM